MIVTDIYALLQWWLVLFLLGIICLPITSKIFAGFFDKGYIFSKVFGIVFVTYLVFVFGVLHLLSFTIGSVLLAIGIVFIANMFVDTAYTHGVFLVKKRFVLVVKSHWRAFIFEEAVFFLTLAFWAYIRAHQPDIHGLEKYMDFGFINSALRSTYFPPQDMWFPPLSINYYYFGHIATAMLTKLSLLPSSVTYNLMLATLFAFTFTQSFSLGAVLYDAFIKTTKKIQHVSLKQVFIAGFITAFLVALAGNFHAVYTYFAQYATDTPTPFWMLQFLPKSFPNAYWYPNATRFIPYTIHEFPIYSFVVSDLHGHVLDIPVVLLTIALLFTITTHLTNLFSSSMQATGKIIGFLTPRHLLLVFLGLLLAVMYMTNVWDGIIYLLLAIVTLCFVRIITWHAKSETQKNIITIGQHIFPTLSVDILIMIVSYVIFSLPFAVHFKPFASGIGVLCAPSFLTHLGKIGPLLFETNHCQRSALWQLLILYGFFYFWVSSFVFYLIVKKKFSFIDIYVLLLIGFSTLLIIIPEFIYVKDIYPMHYRANTMFKLVYQSFILLSLSSGYIIVRLLSASIGYIKEIFVSSQKKLSYIRVLLLVWWIVMAGAMLYLVTIYPFFAIRSYYEDMREYKGLDGIAYLKTLHPDDYKAIQWINTHISGQPVLLEAQGDSYTDYERISANTGLPTVLGWTVHEWLWRGTYDIPAPRITDVQTLYTGVGTPAWETLRKKYAVSYIYLGDLEREKYPTLQEQAFIGVGTVVYQSGKTKIYKLTESL